MACARCSRGDACLAPAIAEEVHHLGIRVGGCMGCAPIDTILGRAEIAGATPLPGHKAAAFVVGQDGSLEHWRDPEGGTSITVDGARTKPRSMGFAVPVPGVPGVPYSVCARAAPGAEGGDALVVLSIRLDEAALRTFVADFSHNIPAAARRDLRPPSQPDDDDIQAEFWRNNMDEYMAVPFEQAYEIYREERANGIRNGLCLFRCCTSLRMSTPFFMGCESRIRSLRLPFVCPGCGASAAEPERDIMRVGPNRLEALRGKERYLIDGGELRVM